MAVIRIPLPLRSQRPHQNLPRELQPRQVYQSPRQSL